MVQARPFDDSKVNFIEMCNEGTILICSYLLYGFTDYVQDDQAKATLGLVFIAVISIDIGLNWLVLIHSNIVMIHTKIKTLCKRKTKN